MPDGPIAPGPRVEADGSVTFTVWAPRAGDVELYLVDAGEVLPMKPRERGYYFLRTDRAGPGTPYLFRLDGTDYPDPASRSQPDGVHGPSRVVDFSLVEWHDEEFVPHDLADLVIYEMHVGTFTPEGTIAAAAQRLPQLAELGITAVEVMPVAEFPGRRNWGYDGVSLYAADSSYGGPLAFARFVDAAHAAGLSVLLDLVFNHFGPEGNYSGRFGDYTTGKYRSPWGDAVNVDGPGSDEVRAFFFGCAEHWLVDCHVDGFRLDAIHEIHDESAIPFLSQLSDRVARIGEETGRPRLLIAESGLNDRRVVEPTDRGGRGMDAAWSDDFHHAIHSHVTGETEGYYADFGPIEQVARAVELGWCLAWDYSNAHRRHHGNDPSSLPRRRFVFCTQNHDQVGNRMLGERLRSLAGPSADRAARALGLLVPYVPLVFMGQEYGEERPFLYFVDHTDPDLLEATRKGRAREFAAFASQGTPPDPGAEETFRRSVLDWPGAYGALVAGENQDARPAGAYANGGPADELALTRALLALRRRYDCFRPGRAGEPEVEPRSWSSQSCVVVDLRGPSTRALVVANLGTQPATVELAGRRLNGAGAALEVVLSLDESHLEGALVTEGTLLALGGWGVVA
ncbi:MAG: malto-oligosyltrehalose trehalohydrolase, partial [Spirochaetota bacterium]